MACGICLGDHTHAIDEAKSQVLKSLRSIQECPVLQVSQSCRVETVLSVQETPLLFALETIIYDVSQG